MKTCGWETAVIAVRYTHLGAARMEAIVGFLETMNAADESTTASLHLWHKGPIAQRLEQQTHNLLVPGSNPGGPTKD
jgi:hypothetical protein